ncbi:hypothetical protein ColLi_02335 [Colletotrichum liriopes]|uniref:Extracellular membrane protein CFEM domain-containing protein n=1 Tax=Colletotrichum liriopes TaxID=708192 RepID=A0AA37LPN6_9PEZI|nr:hypothetical protein ColLi_02335 [Colletotrichum liriopes]
MALKPLLWTLSLTLSASFAAATSFNLSSEITRLVPLCARECFRSHLSANYALTTCGSAPSLQCLCANVGFSGLTIGEGAVQCIVAEKSIGFCRESDAPQTVIDAAYQIHHRDLDPTHIGRYHRCASEDCHTSNTPDVDDSLDKFNPNDPHLGNRYPFRTKYAHDPHQVKHISELYDDRRDHTTSLAAIVHDNSVLNSDSSSRS